MRTGLLCLLVACSGPAKSSSSTPPTGDTLGSGDSRGTAGSRLAGPRTPADVAGFYSGQWGSLVLRAEGDTMKAVYSHDQGTIVGTYQNDMLVGWWCEAPSRKPTQDAGDVELKFILGPADKPAIDGRWRYGGEGEWREDWDIEMAGDEPPADLVARFDDASAFCAKP